MSAAAKRFTTPAGTTYVLPANAGRAVGRFQPGGPVGYVAWPLADSPVLPTRESAEYLYCAALCVPARWRAGQLRYVRWDVDDDGVNTVQFVDAANIYRVRDNACVVATPRSL